MLFSDVIRLIVNFILLIEIVLNFRQILFENFFSTIEGIGYRTVRIDSVGDFLMDCIPDITGFA